MSKFYTLKARWNIITWLCDKVSTFLQIGSEQSDTDADEDDSTERADSASTDEDEEVFYDALELARSGSLGSVGRSGSLDPALSGTVPSANLPNEIRQASLPKFSGAAAQQECW